MLNFQKFIFSSLCYEIPKKKIECIFLTFEKIMMYIFLGKYSDSKNWDLMLSNIKGAIT